MDKELQDHLARLHNYQTKKVLKLLIAKIERLECQLDALAGMIPNGREEIRDALPIQEYD